MTTDRPGESPMLQRVREKNAWKSFSIPRRGRIRVVLLVAAFAIGARIYIAQTQTEHVEEKLETAQAKAPEGKEDPAPQKSTVVLPGEKPKKSIFAKPQFTRHHIVDLFATTPPELSANVQAYTWNRQKIELHYSTDTSLYAYCKKLLKRYHPKYGAIALIHPPSGRVLSLVSYTNPDEQPISKNLHSQSIFPAASVIKIVAAAAAVEKHGFNESSELRTLGANHTLYLRQLEKEPKTFRKVTLQEAFAYSINPVFGRLGIYVLGQDGLREYSEKFGFNSSIPFVLPVGVSTIEVGDSAFTLAELASGFNRETLISPFFGSMMAGAVSNDGRMAAPMLVDSVVDTETGEKIYVSGPTVWRIPCNESTAKQLRNLMYTVARFGTARKSFSYVKRSSRFADIQYGGKTGNVNKDGLGRVDWFVGFARHESDPDQHIAVGVVTVHGPYWTVRSSYLGAEIMRQHIRRTQIDKQKAREQAKIHAAQNTNTETDASPGSKGES